MSWLAAGVRLGGRGVRDAVGVGVIGVGVREGVGEGVRVGVCVIVGVRVGRGVRVRVGVLVRVGVGVRSNAPRRFGMLHPKTKMHNQTTANRPGRSRVGWNIWKRLTCVIIQPAGIISDQNLI